MAEYIDLEVRLNAQEAMKDAAAFADGVKGKMGEVDEAIKATGKIMNGVVDAIPESPEERLLASMFGGVDIPQETFKNIEKPFTVLNSALSSMRNGLQSIGEVMESGSVTDGLTSLFDGMYRTISSGMKKITDYTNSFSRQIADDRPVELKKFVGGDRERNVQLAAASGMRAAANATYLSKLIQTGDFGVTRSELDELIPSIKQYATSKVSHVQSGLRGTGTIDDIADILSEREDFQKTLSTATKGKTFTRDQVRNVAKLIAASQGYAVQGSKDFLDSVGFEEELKLFQSDYFPDKSYAQAFKGYGNPFSEITRNANGADKTSRNAYGAIWNLVRNGNQQAIRLAEQVGLVRSKNGRYEYTASATTAQMETLAALAMQSIHDAKTSLPYHYVDPDDPGKQQNLINRQNKVYQQDMEIVEALHAAGISPNIYSGYQEGGSNNVSDIIRTNPSFSFIEDERVKSGKRQYNKRNVGIRTLGTKDMFVIPQTIYDENGQLIVRDPSWQKENGVKKQAEDHFITIGRSALTDMLGMTGANTYGYGRENGKARYDKPKLFRIDTSNLYEDYEREDRSRGVRVKAGKEAEAERINKLFNREITEKYGDDEYIAAYADGSSLTMMLKSEYDRISREAQEAGLENPLDNMNIGGRFGKNSYSANMKAINLQAKMATPGHRYEQLGYKSAAPLTALVDFSAMYDLAGVEEANPLLRKNSRMDGVTFYDPRVMPFNAQMREGLVDKYLGVREDWRKLLSEGGYLENALNSNKHPGLITRNSENGYGYSFYMPQIGLGSERVKELVSEMDRLQTNIDQRGVIAENDIETKRIDEEERAALDAIRNTYFYDVMDKKWEGIMSDTAVKNDDKWRLMRGRNFKKMAEKGVFDKDIIPAAIQGRSGSISSIDEIGDDEIVELTAFQQAKHLQEAGKKYGLWINNTSDDFQVKKDFIPESLATAMGLGIKERTASTAAYNDYVKGLQNDEVVRQEYLASIPLGRMLLASGQQNGSLARKLISARIADLEESRQQGHVFMPGENISIGLTAPKAGSTINPIFKGLFNVGPDNKTEIGRMLQATSDENSVVMQTLSDEELAKLGANAQVARLMLSRMPAAPGEYSPDSENLGDVAVIRKAMARLGMDTTSTVYTDPRLQYRLMTGDYDGDTAWVVKGLSNDRVEMMRQIVQKKQAAAQQLNDELGGQPLTLPEKEVSQNTRLTDYQLGDIQSTIDMGTTSAAIRNGMAMDDNDPVKWKTIAQAITEYDLATSDTRKKGQSIRMSKMTADAVREGALFRRFVKQINSFATDPDHADNPRIFSSRLPVIGEDAELADMAYNFAERRNGGTVGDTFGSHLDEWLHEQYGDSQSGEALAARHYAGMMKNLTSARRLNTQSDIGEGRKLAYTWYNELETRRRAGEDVTEETSHWSSYLRRLEQAEKEGATYENITKRKQETDAKISELARKQSRTTEENNRLENLRGLSTVYEGLLTPFSEQMQKVDAIWDEEVDTMRKTVQDRVEANRKIAEKQGVDTSNNRGLMNRVFARNAEAAAAMNWTDVAPWMYEQMQKDKAEGKEFALSGIKERALLTSDQSSNHPGEEPFNPYPHYDTGIREQKVKTMARELTKGIKGLEQFGYESTGATTMGSIRHETFEEYLKQVMKGEKAPNIADLYAKNLQAYGFDGVDLSVEEKDGQLILKGLDADTGLQAGINAALGSFDKSSGTFKGGTLDAFANQIIQKTIASGGRIANIEGANYRYGQNQNGENYVEQLNGVSGRGTRIVFPVKYKDSAGYEQFKEGTFAPDLVMANQNGTFDMYDYKSGKSGAIDSLYQMMVYAKDIQQKANAWRQFSGDKAKAEKEKAEKEGWLQYVDDKGNLKFNAFHGFDTTSGIVFDYNARQDVIDKVYDYYHRGQEAKMEGARNGEYQEAISYIQAQLDAGNIDVQRKKSRGIAESVLRSDGFKSDAYRNYVAQKFLKDDEELDEINSFIGKKNRKLSNLGSSGFSPYSMYREELDQMVDPDRLENLKKEWGDSEEAQQELALYQHRIKTIRDNLNNAERLDAVQSFSDIRGDIRQTLYGTKDSYSLNAIESIQQRILNAAQVRDKMKENKDFYSLQNGEWINKDAETAYKESLKEQARIENEFDNLLPNLTAKQISRNKKGFESLISNSEESTAEESIQEYYNQRYDNIQKYIQQQESDIDKYQTALKKKVTTSKGQVDYYQGAQRQAIEQLLADATEKRQEATNLLSGGRVSEYAMADYEKAIGFYSQGSKKRKSQKLEEYADYLLSSKYDQSVLDEMEKSQSTGDWQRIVDLEENAQRARKRASQIKTQAKIQKEIEGTEDTLSEQELDSLYNRSSVARSTDIERKVLQAKKRRERYIEDQVANNGRDEEWAESFRATHSDEMIRLLVAQENKEQQEAQLPALFAKAASYNARANRLNGLPMPETASGGLISYITPAERQQMFQEEIARLEEITPAPVIPSISEEEKQRRINERYNELAKDVLPQAHTIEELQEKYDNIQIPEITSGRRKAVSQERYQQQQQRREEERVQRAENRTRQSFEDAKYIASNIGYDPRTQDDFDKTLALRDAIANVSFEDYQKYLQTEKAPKNLEAAMDAIKLAQTNESLYQQRGESYLDHKDAFKRITWDIRNNLDSIISDYSGPLDSPKLDKRFRREFSRKDFKQAKQLLDSRVDENGNSYLPATVADLANSGLLYEAAGYSTLPEVAALHGSTGKRRNAIVSAATQLGDLGLLDKEIVSRVQELTAHDLETNNQGKLHGFMDSEGRLFGYEKRHKDAIAKADSIYQYRLESIDAQYGRKQREEISQVEQDWAQKEAEFDERERVAAKKTQNKKRKRSESSVISQEQANIRAERLAAEEEKNLQIQQINDRYEGSEERLTAIREAEKERNEAVEKANSDYKATRSILRQNGLLKRTYTRGSLTGTFKMSEEEPAEQEDKRFKLHADAKELSYKIAQGKTRQIERRDAAIAEQSEAAAAIVQEKKDTETRAKAATAAKTEINAQIAQETAKANQEALRQRKQDIQTQAQANVNNQIMAMQGGIPFGAPSGNPPPSSPSEVPSIPSAPVTGYDQNELNARALAAQQIAQERQVLRQLKENSTKETRSAQEQEIVDAMEKRLSPEGAAAYADRLTQDNLIKQQQQEQLVEEQRAVQLAAMRERNDLALTQSDRNFRKQDRQLNRYAFRGNIARSFFMLQDRREGLTSQQEQLLQQRKELLRTNSLAQERLANYDGDKNGKEYKALKHEADVAAQNVQNVDAKLGQVGEQMKSLSGPGATASAVFKGLGRSAMQAVGRLGVQVWRKGIQEAKRFIKEYDKCMTEIQMITLKSNEQINTLGTNLIGKASELKVSFTDVSQTATALYRQGLSDAEVNERLDTILKFSKVSGTKAEAATKLVTVATNTGLTESASEAADIVTSLGDSAATNAAEIEKGIEKAGAAAAADGTSFAQLSALLTAITSTTQIGGNVAGRTINTIMARMNKIGTNELIYDENGNAVSGSNVAKLLEAQGVRVYDQKGNKRSTFDVLYDLSKNWDNISDAERSQLSTEIAGTRMYSNFAAIMQGMQEGDIDRYLELADNSEGIVNQKYTAYERSYAASQEALKSGFDHFVKNYFGWTGNVAKGFNNSVGGFFEDIASLTDDGEAKAAKARAARRNSYQAYYTDKYSGTDRLEVLRNKENRTASENEEYYGLIQTLSNRFNIDIDDFSTSLNEINDTANTASGAVDNVSTAFETVAQNADQAAQRILDQVKAEKGKDLRNRIISESNSYAFDINKELTTNREEQFSAKDNIYNPLFEGLYSIGEDGKLTLHENAADTLSKRFSEYARNDAFGGLWGGLAGADVSANQDITPLLSQTLAKIGAKYLNDGNSEGLRRLHVRGDISNAADPNYWTKSLNEYIGLPQDTAQELLDYYVLYSSEQSSDSTLKSEAKRTMTDLFGEFYNESEIDYLAEDLVQKIISNKKYGTDKQGAINDAILSYLPGEDENAFAITDAVIARYRENLEDSDVFHEIGLPDVGNNGYYINKSNGERVYREDLLNYYRTDYTEQAKNLLLPTTDLNSVVLPNGKKLTDNQIKKIEDIRKGNTQYNYLSAKDQNYLKNLYPAVPNASNYTAVNSYIDNSAFEEKNKVGLAADSLIQALNSQNFTTFDDFYSYYKRSPEISNILDPILSNVLQSAQLVNGKWISQPDTLKQVEDVLYANSYSYGKKQRTASETGNLANYAFNALQYGTGFVTKEDKEAAIQAYKKDMIDTAYFDFDASKNKYDASTDEEIIDLMLQDENISETKREALTGLKTLMRGRILSETEIEALKSVIGERLYLKERSGEKFEGENLEYIRTKLLNNATGLTDFTTKQRADNIRRLRTLQAEGNLNTVDEEIVKDELKGWNNADRWYALATKSNRNSEEQIAFENLNEELRQIQENADVEVSIEGISVLEKAGKVAEGTANALKEIAKGGVAAQKAIASIQNSTFSREQYAAMLTEGTLAERTEAIKYYSGWDDKLIEKDRKGAYEAATLVYNAEQEQLRTTAKALTNSRLLVSDANSEQALAINQTAKAYGLEWDNKKDEYIVPEILQGLFRSDALAGSSPLFTGTQIAEAQKRLLLPENDANRLTKDNTEEYELYIEAARQAGEQTKEYFRMLEQNQTALDEGKDAIYTQDQISAQLAKANAEIDLTAKDNADKDILRDLELSGNTFAYSQEQYRQNNKAGLAANEIYRTLSSADVKSVDELMGVLGDRNNAQNWKDLLESSPALTKKLSDMGLSMDENGNWDVSGLIASSDDAASALSALAGIVREASEAYTHEDQKTTGEKYQAAMDYLSGNPLDEAKSYSAMSDIFGQPFAEEVGSAYKAWRPQYDARQAWETDLAEAQKAGNIAEENRLLENEVVNPGAFNPYANMSEYNSDLAQILVQNAQFGQYGLTDVQRYDEMNRLFEQANTMGGIAKLRNQDALRLYDQFVTGGVEGFDEWTKGVEALNNAGIALSDFNEESEACQKALAKAGIAVNNFADNNKKMAGQLRAAEIETKKLYGENSSDIANRIRQLTGSEKDRAAALKEMTANYDKFNQVTYARNQWNAGKKKYKDIASAIGQSEEWVKNTDKHGDSTEITRLLDVEWEVDNQQVLSDMQAQIDAALTGIDEEKFAEALVKLNVNGEYDISGLQAVAAQADAETAAIINNLIAAISAYNGSVTFGASSDGKTIDVKATSVKAGGKGGGGYSGGGGGGGGKSEAEKLLEKQKREQSRLQHEMKMLEIQEKHYDRTNEYADYMGLLDEEIAKQRELEGLYANNVAELQSMLAGMSEEDDDFDKVASALYEAQEALADISNQIDEINAKRIQIVTEKQENEDKPQTHKLTQIGNLATRYMDAKEYENYYKAMQMQIDATREQITQNEGQIAEWENMLTQYQEGSDDWIEIRDNIWAMREENASLENQALEDIIAMNQQKISQISEELERSQSFDNHAINMWSTYGGMYESNGQHADYRNTLSQQNTYYQTNISSYQTAISQLQSLLATLDKTSDEWYSARDAIFQYEEAIAQAKNAILENNKAIQESTVSELTTNYDRMTSDLNHEVKMLQDQKQIYDDANDYEAYIEMMKKEKEATVDMVRSMKSSLATMESTIGTIDEDSDAWWNLHDKILSVREAISSSEVSLANFDRQIEQSKIDHLVEKFGQIDDMDQHNLKMIQYEETRYQNAGELTNYGTMLGIENEYQQRYADDLTDHIRLLKAERDNVETGSDAYYKLEQTIAKYEEQLEATNNTIEKNNKLLEQNKEKIRQTVMAVENIVDKEYRARIQKTRDMLAAEVNMQNTILDTIKKRYNDEFELEKRRINQLKENLNREKSLINERLNARKEAVDESNQYEELAEYKRQLALLAADPTRTKEYKEMQKRIQDMEESMSYDIAAKEVQSEGERIDDQIAAYDQYLTTAQEDLNMLLSDSQALMAAAQSDFGYNVAELMAGSWTDLLAWLQENNVNFRNATEELQTQMVQGWEDTWKKMWGIIDTYWDEISVIIGDQTSFMDYMKDSDTFAAASETGQKSLEYSWGETYEAMINAQKTGADYDHIHELATEFTSKIDEAKDWTYKVQLEGANKDLIGSFGLNDYLGYGLDHTPVDVSDIFWDDLYTGIGKVIEEYIGYSGGGGWGGEEEGSGSGGEVTVYYQTSSGNTRSVTGSSVKDAYSKVPGNALNASTNENQLKSGTTSTYDTTSNVQAGIEAGRRRVAAEAEAQKSSQQSTSKSSNKEKEVIDEIKKQLSGGAKFAEGGLVNYTGPAWVDGTPTKPESFLDAIDTKHIAALTDALNYVSISSHPIVNPDTYSNHNTTVGDINIVINQAELKSDEDVERLAKQVGKAFSRQLSKQGLNLNSVSF